MSYSAIQFMLTCVIPDGVIAFLRLHHHWPWQDLPPNVSAFKRLSSIVDTITIVIATRLVGSIVSSVFFHWCCR